MSIHDKANHPNDSEPMCGYPVGPRKFWLMMILTARVYAVYWAYKNFLALDSTPAKRPRILAGINGLFIVFRFNRFMKLVEAQGAKHDVPVKFPRIFYMICLFVLIPAIGVTMNYFAVPLGWAVPVVLTTWIFSQPNNALLKINKQLNPRTRFDGDFTRNNYILVAVSLAFIFFYPHELTPFQWLQGMKGKQYCRWINDDPNNKREQEIKAIRVKAMDRFWNYFKTVTPDLYDPNRKDVAGSVLDKDLEMVHPYLAWQADESVDEQGKKIYDVTIYSTQNPDLLPIIRAMIARAPKFSNCRYRCYKQPLPPSKLKNKLEISRNVAFHGFKAKCNLTRDNLIAVEITCPEFTGEDDESDLEAAQALTEMVLGQDATFSWLAPVKTKKGAVDVSVESAARELKSDFELLKQVARNKLPNKFYYQLNNDELEKAFALNWDADSMSEEPVSKPEFVPNMPLAITRFPFSSERFSKNGEKFVFLVTRIKGDDATIDKFAKETDVQLMAQKAGIAFWSVSEDGKMRVLYGISDFNKAVPIIRKACEKFHFSPQTWILYLDSELDNEEIRLFSDTKPFE